MDLIRRKYLHPGCAYHIPHLNENTENTATSAQQVTAEMISFLSINLKQWKVASLYQKLTSNQENSRNSSNNQESN